MRRSYIIRAISWRPLLQRPYRSPPVFADGHVRRFHIRSAQQAPTSPNSETISVREDDPSSLTASSRPTPGPERHSNNADSFAQKQCRPNNSIPSEETSTSTPALHDTQNSSDASQAHGEGTSIPQSERWIPDTGPAKYRPDSSEWRVVRINREVWHRNYRLIYGRPDVDVAKKTLEDLYNLEALASSPLANEQVQLRLDMHMRRGSSAELESTINTLESEVFKNEDGLSDNELFQPNGRPTTILPHNFHLVRLAPETDHYLELVLSRGTDQQGILEGRREIPRQDLPDVWPNIMLKLLMDDPGLALHVLVGMKIWPGQFVVSNMLKFILASAFQPYIRYEQRIPQSIFALIMELLWVYPYHLHRLHKSVFYLLFTHSDEAQLQELLALFRHAPHHIGCDTLLHLATSLGRVGLHDDALFVLQHASKQDDFHRREEVFQKVCTIILRNSLKREDGYKANTRLIAGMVDIGLRLNVIHYNVLLYNAFRADDLEAAKTLFDLYHQVGVEPDDFTVATMLYGLQRSAADHDLKRAIVDQAIQMLQQRPNSALADHVLRARYSYSKHDGSPLTFQETLRAYRSMFSDQVLRDLGICEEATYPLVSHDTVGNLPPTGDSIKTVLHAYMSQRKFIKAPQNLISLYTRFRKLIQEKSEHAPVLDLNILYNLFMDRFGRRRKTVHLCLDVLVDMTGVRDDDLLPPRSWIEEYFESDERPSLSSDKILGSKLVVPERGHGLWGRRLRQHEPDVYTYNILLRSFMRHQHFEATSRVLMLMAKNKIDPNTVTWNTLATSYALSGQLQDAADTLNAMEREGIAVTDDSMRTLASVGGKRLAQEMDRRKNDDGRDAHPRDGVEPSTE